MLEAGGTTFRSGGTRPEEVPTMIVRVWEAEVKPGQIDRLLDLIRTSLLPRVVAADGFLGVEFLRSLHDDQKLVAVSRWRDEQALADYAGPLWEVWAPKVDSLGGDYLARPSHVHHYLPVDLQPPVASTSSATVRTTSAEPR